MGGSVIEHLPSAGRMLSHNFVAQFTSAGILTGRALFDGMRYGSTDPSGTGRGVSDFQWAQDRFLQAGSAGTFWVAYACVASHGQREPFFPTLMSSGTGGGIQDRQGLRKPFSYTKIP